MIWVYITPLNDFFYSVTLKLFNSMINPSMTLGDFIEEQIKVQTNRISLGVFFINFYYDI